MSDTPESIEWLNDPNQHIKVACRLCSEVWKFPLTYEQSFKENPSWECPYCRRKWNMLKGRNT